MIFSITVCTYHSGRPRPPAQRRPIAFKALGETKPVPFRKGQDSGSTADGTDECLCRFSPFWQRPSGTDGELAEELLGRAADGGNASLSIAGQHLVWTALLIA